MFKNLVVFSCLFVGISLGASAQISSDTASLPYGIDDVLSTVSEAFEYPTERNSYVLFLSTEANFPNLKVGEVISEESKKTLRNWIKTNPDKIEKLLISRKKNHDYFYNLDSKN